MNKPTQSKNAEYKFKTNLINASCSEKYEDAIKEWEIICEKNNCDGVCICQHKLKNVIYMINIMNKNIIMVGRACYKKFKLQINEMSNVILKDILKNSLMKGEYTIIDNIITYCNSVKEQLIKHFQKKIENIEKKSQPQQYLTNILNDINNLIQKYNLEYLKDIHILISDKLK